jgi:siroheme synthase
VPASPTKSFRASAPQLPSLPTRVYRLHTARAPSSVAIVTGYNASRNHDQIKWSGLARSVDTLVILMGLHRLKEIMNRLLEGGCEPQRPVALIQSGTRLSQRSVVGTVATIADLAEGQISLANGGYCR